MMCTMTKCYNNQAVGWVVDIERDPDRVLMAPLCGQDLRAAATIPGYEVHLFKAHRAPEGYK
jgi:hypothetical protein